jgi:hypothetical protein
MNGGRAGRGNGVLLLRSVRILTFVSTARVASLPQRFFLQISVSNKSALSKSRLMADGSSDSARPDLPACMPTQKPPGNNDFQAPLYVAHLQIALVSAHAGHRLLDAAGRELHSIHDSYSWDSPHHALPIAKPVPMHEHAGAACDAATILVASQPASDSIW